MAFSTILLTINSGEQHSNIANIRNSRAAFMTLVANDLTSCQMFLQTGTQANSASLKRMDVMPTNTGSATTNWIWWVGVGSRQIFLPTVGPFLRFETSVLQADNRSLGLVVGGL